MLQGPTVLAAGAGGVVLVFFSLTYHIYFLSPSSESWLNITQPLNPKQPTKIFHRAPEQMEF